MDTIFQTFDNVTFSNLWSTKEDFVNAYKTVGFPSTYTLEDGSTHDYVTDNDLELI